MTSSQTAVALPSVGRDNTTNYPLTKLLRPEKVGLVKGWSLR